MATGFHIRADERHAAVQTTLWASIAGLVAVGRWDLISSRADIPSWVLVTALVVLIPVTIVSIMALWRSTSSTNPEPRAGRAVDTEAN
jgi:hypothetical protein